MQKKVIALAVAALASGAAMAQSNVTIYGLMDAVGTNFSTNNDGFVNKGTGGRNALTGASFKNQRGVDDGAVGSRIGFKGVEDLGNGLTADWLYEFGLSPVNNVGVANTVATANATTATGSTLNNFQTRQAWVGLNSNVAGSFQFGYFSTDAYWWMAGARPWGGVDPLRTTANAIGMSANTSDRISGIRYVTPTFSGFTAAAAYGDNSNNKNINTNDQNYANTSALGRQGVFTLNAKYVNGPIYANTFYRLQNRTANQSYDDGKYEYGVSGAYDFGVAKVGANYQRQHLNVAKGSSGIPGLALINGYTGTFQTGYSYSGYVTVPIGASFLVTAEASKSKGDLGVGASGYMLNGQYLFSKRTSIYAQAGRMNINSQTAAISNYVNLGSYGSVGIESGKHVNAMMAGLLHTF